MWPMNHSSSTSGQKLETRCGSTRLLLLQSALQGKLWRKQVIGPFQARSEKQPHHLTSVLSQPQWIYLRDKSGNESNPLLPTLIKNLPQLCSSTNAQGVSNNSVATTSLFKH